VVLKTSGTEIRSWLPKKPRATTYVIAARNSPDHVKAQADYLCDNYATDKLASQALIDKLELLGGGVGYWAEGDYTGMDGLTVEGDYIGIKGSPKAYWEATSVNAMLTIDKPGGGVQQGCYTKRLRMRNYGNGDGVQVGGNATEYFVNLEHIRFTGNNNVSQSAFYLLSFHDSYAKDLTAADTGCLLTLGGASRSSIRTARADSMTDGVVDMSGTFTEFTLDDIIGKDSAQGIRVRGTLRNVTLQNSRIYHSLANGYIFGKVGGVASDQQVEDFIVSNCEASFCGTKGFFFDVPADAAAFHHGIQFIGCKSHDNDEEGFFIDQAKHITLVGIQSWNNGKDVGAAAKNRSGILINNSQYVNISGGSQLYDDQGGGATQQYGIYEDAASNNNKFTDNMIDGNVLSPIFKTGAATIIRNNTGYITENSGTPAVGTGAQQAIPHGLNFTPTIAQIALIAGSATANPYHSAAPDANNIYVTALLGQAWYWATVG
jgi:hypothetical protein